MQYGIVSFEQTDPNKAQMGLIDYKGTYLDGKPSVVLTFERTAKTEYKTVSVSLGVNSGAEALATAAKVLGSLTRLGAKVYGDPATLIYEISTSKEQLPSHHVVWDPRHSKFIRVAELKEMGRLFKGCGIIVESEDEDTARAEIMKLQGSKALKDPEVAKKLASWIVSQEVQEQQEDGGLAPVVVPLSIYSRRSAGEGSK